MILAVLAANAFLQMFGGNWTCSGNVPWNITAAPGGTWTRVEWGDQRSKTGGIAYVGYVPQEKQWVYQDFHYDGSFALTTSKGPDGATWTWAGGGYYTKDAVLHGKIVWRLASPTLIERTFTALDDKGAPESTDPPQIDHCTKSG